MSGINSFFNNYDLNGCVTQFVTATYPHMVDSDEAASAEAASGSDKAASAEAASGGDKAASAEAASGSDEAASEQVNYDSRVWTPLRWVGRGVACLILAGVAILHFGAAVAYTCVAKPVFTFIRDTFLPSNSDRLARIEALKSDNPPKESAPVANTVAAFFNAFAGIFGQNGGWDAQSILSLLDGETGEAGAGAETGATTKTTDADAEESTDGAADAEKAAKTTDAEKAAKTTGAEEAAKTTDAEEAAKTTDAKGATKTLAEESTGDALAESRDGAADAEEAATKALRYQRNLDRFNSDCQRGTQRRTQRGTKKNCDTQTDNSDWKNCDTQTDDDEFSCSRRRSQLPVLEEGREGLIAEAHAIGCLDGAAEVARSLITSLGARRPVAARTLGRPRSSVPVLHGGQMPQLHSMRRSPLATTLSSPMFTECPSLNRRNDLGDSSSFDDVAALAEEVVD